MHYKKASEACDKTGATRERWARERTRRGLYEAFALESRPIDDNADDTAGQAWHASRLAHRGPRL
jgi:hypothetical protein